MTWCSTELALIRNSRTGVLSPLNDPGYFAEVTVDPEAGTIDWPGGIDLVPDPLYDRRRPIRFLPPDTLAGNALPLSSGQARICQYPRGLPCCFTSAGRRHLTLPQSRGECVIIVCTVEYDSTGKYSR
jgi:hypothetical protein